MNVKVLGIANSTPLRVQYQNGLTWLAYGTIAFVAKSEIVRFIAAVLRTVCDGVKSAESTLICGSVALGHLWVG
ncbi:hypothetical protein DND62_24285 [Pseudomonas syringae pv. pisi]|jgi:hypothetical protein|nr:hypothetical protein DND62_24285 [Pseudomonas syringae pv. pisi]